MNVLDTLETRGYIEQVTDEEDLRKLLIRKMYHSI